MYTLFCHFDNFKVWCLSFQMQIYDPGHWHSSAHKQSQMFSRSDTSYFHTYDRNLQNQLFTMVILIVGKKCELNYKLQFSLPNRDSLEEHDIIADSELHVQTATF